MKPSLYSPLTRHLALLQTIEAAEGELTPELEAEFTLTAANVQQRAADLLDFRDTVQGFLAAGEAKVAQAQAFIAAQKRVVAQLDHALGQGVRLLGPILAGTRKLTLRPSVAVEITDEAAVPHAYRAAVKVPAAGAPDKASIKKALLAGEVVAGARLDHRSSLQVN